MNMSTPDILQVSAEIADAWLEDAYLDPIWEVDENGDDRCGRLTVIMHLTEQMNC